MSADEKKYRAKPQREFFVHWVGKSYWDCTWISEIQMEVFNPTTLRAYWKKFDMEEPPKLDEDEQISRRRKHAKDGKVDVDPLEERFYKNGIRPEWLQIHRIINHQTLRDGRIQYLIKWRELAYDKVSWEEEDKDIPNFKEAIEKYHVRGGSRKLESDFV
jgi:chromodomain-helicase-DNA-binding protein 4